MILSGFKRKLVLLITAVFIYNTFGFLLMQPVLTIYFVNLGMQRAANPSEGDKIELIVLKKEDILLKRINFKRINQEEFRLNEKYYDIVKEVEKDSSIYFYCLNDEREDALEKEFRNKVDENAANKKQKPENNNPFKTLTTEPVIYLVFKQVNTGNQQYSFFNNKLQVQAWRDVPTPPPRFPLFA